MENNEGFSYTYSAARQQEVERIRSKYIPKEEGKMEQLRKLHHSATRKAMAWAITLGVIGALILGTGMSLVMTDLGQILGMSLELAMVVGVSTGLVGLVMAALAYPVYNHLLKKERARIAPEILRLTDELMQ